MIVTREKYMKWRKPTRNPTKTMAFMNADLDIYGNGTLFMLYRPLPTRLIFGGDLSLDYSRSETTA